VHLVLSFLELEALPLIWSKRIRSFLRLRLLPERTEVPGLSSVRSSAPWSRHAVSGPAAGPRLLSPKKTAASCPPAAGCPARKEGCRDAPQARRPLAGALPTRSPFHTGLTQMARVFVSCEGRRTGPVASQRRPAAAGRRARRNCGCVFSWSVPPGAKWPASGPARRPPPALPYAGFFVRSATGAFLRPQGPQAAPRRRFPVGAPIFWRNSNVCGGCAAFWQERRRALRCTLYHTILSVYVAMATFLNFF
jgi:hypothetical protein